MPRTRRTARLLRSLVLTLATVAAIPFFPTPARADQYPEPSLYPIAWELKFDYSNPKRIVVQAPGDPYPKAYWYMTYTVSNPGDQPQYFAPDFLMLTSDSRLVRSDRAIPKTVFERIKQVEGIKLLEPARKIEGQLNPGEDQARDGVAIWPEPTQRMGTFTIFVGGLSGEYVRMKDKDGKPMTTTNPVTKEQEPIILRKTLMITYQIPGDEVRPGANPVIKKGEKWVMR